MMVDEVIVNGTPLAPVIWGIDTGYSSRLQEWNVPLKLVAI